MCHIGSCSSHDAFTLLFVVKGGADNRSFSVEKFFCQNSLYRGKIMWKINCAHSRILKMLPWLWFREIRVCIEAKIQYVQNHKNPLFWPTNFPESGSGKRLQARECVQSIPRMKLPQEIWFWGRNFKIFRFSLQYIHLFPWIRIKEAFSLFGNAHNRFFAWIYPYISCFGKKIFDR
jgi:hypothetical protein